MATCNQLALEALGSRPIDEFLVVNLHRFCIEVKPRIIDLCNNERKLQSRNSRCEACEAYMVTLLNRTRIFESFMARLV